MIAKEELVNKIKEQEEEIRRLKKELESEKKKFENYKKREEYERVMGYDRFEDKAKKLNEYEKGRAKGIGRGKKFSIRYRTVSCGLLNDKMLLNKGVIYSDSISKTYYGYNKVGNMKIVSRAVIRTRKNGKNDSRENTGYVFGNIFMGYVKIEDVFNIVMEYYFENEERMKQAGIETNIIKGLYMRRKEKLRRKKGIYKKKVVNKYGLDIEEINRKNKEKTQYTFLK